jgi:hypothetical protein
VQRCPWDGHAPSNFDFCEANVCGWIVEPANTWSCLAYVAVGAYLIVRSQRDAGARPLVPIGVTAVLVGVLSGVYHASTIFATEFLDLFSMYTFSAYALVVTVYRVRGGAVRRLIGAYVGLVAVSLALLLLFRPIGVFVFTAQVIAVLVLERRIFRAQPAGADRIDYRHLRALLAWFVAALAAWVPDYTRWLCMPDDHLLQGHAAWHVMNSLCFYFLFRFYRQFDFGGGTRLTRLAASR